MYVSSKNLHEQGKKKIMLMYLFQRKCSFSCVPLSFLIQSKWSKANSLFSHLRERGGSFLLWQSKWKRKLVWFHHRCFRGVYFAWSCLPPGSSGWGPPFSKLCCPRSRRLFNSLSFPCISGSGTSLSCNPAQPDFELRRFLRPSPQSKPCN